MKYNIALTKTKTSRFSQVDFDNIPFGRVFSDHMFVADYDGNDWTNLRIVPFESFSMHPAAMGLHYGQSIFEGMKASKNEEGQPLFFRPEDHARRFNNSARRMCMPEVPEELFLEALHRLVGVDQAWIPPRKGSALYIRPIMFANDEFVGVRPSQHYRFIIFTGPVGPYYPKPVRLFAESHYIRAAAGGVGEAKTAGNYAAAMLPAKMAQDKGFDQVLWLDAREFKYIQEVGTMNIFFVIDGVVVTPAAGGTILRGITRDSAIKILKSRGIPVEERPLSIDEVMEAHQKGTLQEAFGTGTAAVVAHVADIFYNDQLIHLPPMEERHIGQLIKDEIDGLRAGTVADINGWIVPVEEAVSVSK